MKYFAEVTDTFGGEANYCWVRRYIIEASTLRGAVWKLSRHEGLSFRKDYDGRYNARNFCICAFIDEYDADQHGYHTTREI